MAMLEVRNLQVGFDTPEGEVQAVRGIDFDLEAGDALAIVGESGSGKTQSMLALMGLLAENGHASGEARFRGRDLMKLSPGELNQYRGAKIAMIFQDPMTSLNPYLNIEKQMIEVVMHHQGLDRREARAHAIEMLRAVRIPDPEQRIRQYPHEYSGGMRQRVMVAMGLLCEPDILIADEPTTALDVTVQAQINQLMAELRRSSNTAIVLITHDLGVVAGLCDRVLVVYAGRVVEYGTVEQIYYQPRHPYTRGLLASVPRLDAVRGAGLNAIPGNPPNLLDLPAGCSFRQRCAEAFEACGEEPALRDLGDGHLSRCHLEPEQ
ncbi:MAG: ATP-binding cassette domain-containing protein [Xanthomonadales bacterium]|nr:ATP-binding cassette domain-containing protein [Xanthomonadales bacterium]NIN60576.1 ATP-binding cassette domain-containing protein [Xanthomonadales bacterium]NIN75928.1 ATP-binding cassette domain-containing protein [Xanthomonadales bacterium]NIO15020.1 ATP-binding cassette domain-containing protein [Xanthomonadales bacterium]NIP12969.1 ATP-binding cassette domain-containing protein [Xanthomonadales bacterium]